ncbi:hypothetical protein FRC10_003157 [Ceratobasidium sp. 414]|nr:hypothetical protein FRC10_003157 [Ceratobasidium sp. 414]
MEELEVQVEHGREAFSNTDPLRNLAGAASGLPKGLPRLNKFKYFDLNKRDDIPIFLDLRALDQLLKTTPALTTLELPHHMNKPLELIDPLRNVLQLLVLCIDSRPFSIGETDAQLWSHFSDFSQQLGQTCTGLSEVKIKMRTGVNEFWRFERFPGGVANVVRVPRDDQPWELD